MHDALYTIQNTSNIKRQTSTKLKSSSLPETASAQGGVFSWPISWPAFWPASWLYNVNVKCTTDSCTSDLTQLSIADVLLVNIGSSSGGTITVH